MELVPDMKSYLSTVYLASSSLRPAELVPWALAAAAFFLMPDYLALGSRILIFIILVLSLDLLVGYAGIVTLGHGVFFGIGAYATGIASASFGISDPIAQLVISALCAAAVGVVTGSLLLRTSGLTLIMLTLAVLSTFHEIGNRATSVTGGADGLAVTIGSLLGLFQFDLYGKVAYLYSLFILFSVWLFVRFLCLSPFGASLAGIRENRTRMDAIGSRVYRRLVLTYTISAGIAGIAGALLAQTNSFVGLNTLGFDASGELLVMLVLGGVGRIYGAFLGTAVFLIAQDLLARHFPENWLLGIGILLVLVILFARGGLLGLFDRLGRFARTRRQA